MTVAPLLEAVGLTKSFDGLRAIKGVDFSLEEGEIRGVIGPNGSGKSTLFNLFSGVYRVDSGTISYAGKDITGWEPHDIAAAGVARTFSSSCACSRR